METVAENVLKYIGEKYNFEPVQPSHLINGFGYSIPLKGREEMISTTKTLYDTLHWITGECRITMHINKWYE